MKRRLVLMTALTAIATVAGVQGAKADQETYANWTGVSPSTAASATDTDDKTVYLYNVDEKAFLTRGGRWGTEAVLGGMDDLVLPFTVVSNSGSYRLQTSATRTDVSSSSNYYLGFTGTTNVSNDGTPSAYDKYNYFTDISATSYSNWTTFTVSEVSSNSNTYRFSQTVESSWGTNQTAGTYYLQGTQERNSNSTSTEGRNNYVTCTTTASDEGTTWKLVTLKEIKEYAEKVTSISVAADPVTYVIADPDYARNDNAISNWKNNSNSSLSQGWAQTATNQSYYVGNGLADNQAAGQDNYGGTMAANIYGAGKIYQNITTSNLPVKGWYEVSCNVFTTDATANTVKLYASVASSTTYTVDKTKYAEKYAQYGVSSPSTYLESAQTVNTTYTDDNGNTNYLYRVICAVYIDEENSSLQSLQIGVDATNASSTAWTVVDNWQMRYLGNPESIVIIDETKTSADYLVNQNKGTDNNALTTKSTVYMHRSLTAGKWNSLVLPFDLSANAITSKFGSGTVVAEFKGATDENNPRVLHFESASSIKKGHLYLVKPTIGEPSNGSDVTVTSSHDSNLKLTDNFYRFESVNFGGEGATFPDVVKDNITGKEIYTGETNLEFIGTYIQKIDCVKTGSYFLTAASQQDGSGSDGLWNYLMPGDKCNMRGLRGWLSPIDAAQTTDAKFYIHSIYGDVTPTEIDGVRLDPVVRPAAQGIYNLNGQRISNATTTDGLAKGLYIVNGKKVAVK